MTDDTKITAKFGNGSHVLVFDLETMEAELTSPARNPSTKMIPNMDQGLMKKTQSVKTEFGIPMRIFVRKSKRPNLYAEELFRIVREGVRFYEEFIGV